MKNKKSVFFILFVLVCVVFTTCHNAIMDKWWPEDKPKTGKTSKSGENFGIVHLDPDGGLVVDKNGNAAPYVQQDIKLAWGVEVGQTRVFEKTGYGFVGWIDKDGNPWDIYTRKITPDDVGADGYITIKAVWTNVFHSVGFDTSFDPSGGLVEYDPTDIPDQTVGDNGLVSRPVMPTPPPGYGFAGWFDDPDCNDPGFNGTPWDFSKDKITGNKKLYARWEEQFREVNFEPNGGVRPDGGIAFSHTQMVSLSYGYIENPGPLAREGHAFSGWYDNPGFNGTPWSFTTQKVPDGTGPFILYAKWDKKYYNVTFEPYPDVDNIVPPTHPVVIDPNPQVVEHGETIIQPPTPPMLGDGRAFNGWYTKDGTGGDWGELWNFNNIVTDNITLYGRFTPQTRTIAFNLNGGTMGGPSHVTYPIGNQIINPGIPTRSGYNFVGWFLDPAFSGSKVVFNPGLKVEYPDIIIGMDPLYFYAKWETSIHNITFTIVDGLNIVDTDLIKVDQGDRIPRPTINNDTYYPNHYLDGWYYEKDGISGLRWNFENGIVTEPVDLFATWVPTTYFVKFHVQSPTGTLNPTVHNTTLQTLLDELNHLYLEGTAQKILEPFVPALPGTDTANISFLRWDYHPAGSDGTLAGNRAALVPWNFDWPINEKTAALKTLSPGVFELNLYARWVPPVPDMVWVPKGKFIMGDSSVSGSPAAYHAYPARLVSMDGFYISKYPVTQEEYLLKTGNNPSQFGGDITRPVENVSWTDADRYCRVTLGGLHRLPTEAEWEYAAKGGSGMGPYFAYSGSNNPDTVAWYNVTVKEEATGGKTTQPVGGKAPNALGIYDMSGNISEWVSDWFTPYTNLTSQLNNPQGASSGSERVRRGGAWNNAAGNIRSVVRNSEPPSAAHWAVGFRVARSPDLINIH